MIGYLEGRLAAKLADSVLVQTAGGVGYQVFLPVPLLARDYPPETPVRLYVVTVVRDTELALYGFDQPAGKTLFELLVRASGVGPKLALAMLSAFAPDALVGAIATHDVALLATVPGIGKKTAARLCVELGDRLGALAGPPGAALSGRGELISALTNLGFPEKDVVAAVQKIPADGGPLTDQIKQALALLGNV